METKETQWEAPPEVNDARPQLPTPRSKPPPATPRTAARSRFRKAGARLLTVRLLARQAPVTAPQSQGALSQSVWRRVEDPGGAYYLNTVTNSSQWEPPTLEQELRAVRRGAAAASFPSVLRSYLSPLLKAYFPSTPPPSRLTVFQHFSTPPPRQVFTKFDTDWSGYLDRDELHEALVTCGMEVHPSKFVKTKQKHTIDRVVYFLQGRVGDDGKSGMLRILVPTYPPITPSRVQKSRNHPF
jgi:hypothetical protein